MSKRVAGSNESKNGLFKPFSLIAKFFPVTDNCENFFVAVA